VGTEIAVIPYVFWLNRDQEKHFSKNASEGWGLLQRHEYRWKLIQGCCGLNLLLFYDLIPFNVVVRIWDEIDGCFDEIPTWALF